MRISLSYAATVAVLCVLGFAAQPAWSQTGAAAPAAAGNSSVAVIDIPYIFKNLARFKQAINDMKTDFDSTQEFLNQEQGKIRKEAEKIEQYKPGSLEYKQIEESVARMKVELQLEGAKRQKELMEREAVIYFNAYREIEAEVAKFANRNGLNLVLRYSAEPMDPTKRDTIMQGISRMVVYQRELDITGFILDRLNQGTPKAATGAVSGAGTGTGGTRTASGAGPAIPPRRTTNQ